MNPRQVHYRLLSEHVANLMRCDMDELPPTEVARVFVAAYVVLKQHEIDKRGRCRYCNRVSLLRWRRKPCTVYQTFAVALDQPFKVVRAWLEDH